MRIIQPGSVQKITGAEFRLLSHTIGSASCYFPAFHVKTLLKSFSHGKCLARQGTVQDDRLEQVALIHAGQQEGSVSRLAPQIDNYLIAMYIVDLFSSPTL